MRKLSMKNAATITFEEGCNKYLDNCRQRNLREGTIKHYKQSYTQFYKYFDPQMPITDMDVTMYNEYVMYLREILSNDRSINSYLRDLIATLHFLMSEGYLTPFKMQSIKVDQSHIDTYTDDELMVLLQKPNIKTCSFTEYQSWVMTNFLFTTGVRQRSLMNIKVKDVDLDNNVVHVNVTKNRKALIVPLHQSMAIILQEYLKYRQYKSTDDFLFCNAYGNQLVKSTHYHMLYEYNKRRGVETTGIHRYRHTFAKQWIMNGGNAVVLSRLLGHSSLNITQNYVNLLVSDISKEVDEINLLAKYGNKQYIKMKQVKTKRSPSA